MKRQPKHDIAAVLPALFPFVTEAHGRFGRNWVLYMRNGSMFLRIYTSPSNPRTEKQQAHRVRMACAVPCWAHLDQKERDRWNARADAYNRVGRNLFPSSYLSDETVSRRYSGVLYTAVMSQLIHHWFTVWLLMNRTSEKQDVSGESRREAVLPRRFVRRIRPRVEHYSSNKPITAYSHKVPCLQSHGSMHPARFNSAQRARPVRALGCCAVEARRREHTTGTSSLSDCRLHRVIYLQFF